MLTANLLPRADTVGATPKLLFALIVGGAILAASLFGIFTRPIGFLAAVWPANAILLGMMVRNRALASPAAWLAALVGYLAADLLTGSNLLTTVWLTAANMAGAVTGYLYFQMLSEDDRRLQRSVSVLYVFAICCAAALAAAVSGGGAARMLFGRDFADGLAFWAVSELVNYLIVIPIWLTFPGVCALKQRWAAHTEPSWDNLTHAAPSLALLVSVGVGAVIGGPGALAFPIPALLWCALTYGMFTTTVLTMALSTWLLISLPAEMISMEHLPNPLRLLDSIRLGVALMALGPLTVASTNAARRELINRLTHQANHDSLTGALSRHALMERGEACLRELGRGTQDLALLVLDIDHFKRVNDRFGHAAGDTALTEFYGVVSAQLRDGDLFGRTGGEEFVAVLPRADLITATGLAERIRAAIQATRITLPTGEQLRLTTSIGLTSEAAAKVKDFDALLLAADRALYEAKAAGRNTVRIGGGETEEDPLRRLGGQ